MPRTLEEIQGNIRAARDSVWVIDNELEKLLNGQPATTEIRDSIDRNVSHLKLVVADQELIDSGEDISDLLSASTNGEKMLAEAIWP
jgi:hypothetical protein